MLSNTHFQKKTKQTKNKKPNKTQSKTQKPKPILPTQKILILNATASGPFFKKMDVVVLPEGRWLLKKPGDKVKQGQLLDQN